MLSKALDLSGDDGPAFDKAASNGRLRPTLRATTLARASDNLPAAVTSFIGREGELEDLSRLLSRHRLITLTGAAGLGKTRTAIELASRHKLAYMDGVWFVELASVVDRSSIVAKIASATSTRLGNDGSIDALAVALRKRRVLLVLDNCEHVLQHVAAIVQTLLRSCPDVVVVATSRECLSLSGEVTYRIPSLSLPPADRPRMAKDARVHSGIELFVDRAQMADPHFCLSDARAAAVADICRRLDGIALAIEIAAARMPALGLLGLRLKLDDRLTPLTNAFVDAASRQHTLASAIDWSYNLLSNDERSAFRRLSVFAGGFALTAAIESLHNASLVTDGISDVLLSLVDTSLLLSDVSMGETRFAFLECTREFAADRLVDALNGYLRRRTPSMDGNASPA